jgi:signal transduction histidine kinase
MGRLYLKIYVAVLASLALFALLAAVSWVMLRDHHRIMPRPDFYRFLAERIAPPSGAPLEAQRRALEELRRFSGFDVALLAPDGRPIAGAGDQEELFRALGDRRMMGLGRHAGGGRTPSGGPPWRRPPWLEVFPLPDGRWLIAGPPADMRGQIRRFGWLAALIGIALAVAVAAYPLVRRLTRRLETLQESVAALGAGNLAARVKVEGRDEVGRLAETFNRTAERIQQLVTANRALLANASHELRSPLARLRMGVEALKDGPPSPARAEEISRNIRELDQLIEEILLASRLDGAGAMAMASEQVDIVALLAEECAAADATLQTTADRLPLVTGDPRLLKRLFRNLIDNAARHGGGTTAEVTVSGGDQARVTIDVADRGPGVPEAERDRIFEPFYRLKGASETAGGVGLGLALVRQIAERHGGSVACLPREGGGSVFRVTLKAE